MFFLPATSPPACNFLSCSFEVCVSVFLLVGQSVHHKGTLHGTSDVIVYKGQKYVYSFAGSLAPSLRVVVSGLMYVSTQECAGESSCY